MRKYITFPFLWNLSWYFPLLLERNKLEDVTRHLKRGPPCPDAQTWRKCLNVFLWSSSPWTVQGQPTDWKICFGSFVVWLWTFFSKENLYRSWKQEREVDEKKGLFHSRLTSSLPQGFCFGLAFELTFYPGFNLPPSNLWFSLSNLHRLGNTNTNLAQTVIRRPEAFSHYCHLIRFGLWHFAHLL